MHTLCTKTHEREISVIKRTNYETNLNLKINIANTLKGPELHTFKPDRQFITSIIASLRYLFLIIMRYFSETYPLSPEKQ